MLLLMDPDPHTPPIALPRLLEVSHVAHRLGYGQEYVRQLIRDKKLPALRFGKRYRVDPIDLQKFIDAARSGSNGHGG